MAATTTPTPARDIRPGDCIVVGALARWVAEVTESSRGWVVLRCSFSPDSYAGTSLIREAAETVDLLPRLS